MLEYSIDEAEALLEKHVAETTTTITDLKKTLLYLKDQLTTTEVNMARVYNYDVQHRRVTKK